MERLSARKKTRKSPRQENGLNLQKKFNEEKLLPLANVHSY